MPFDRWRTGSALLAVVGALVVAACGPTASKTDYVGFTDDLTFRVTPTPLPPHAREKTAYRVIVRDKKSGKPIVGGQGRIFASTRDGASTWDALDPSDGVGAYAGTLNYITAGEWAVAIQFRRDSTQPLERIDWMQEVAAARGGVP
jgi:hypothetical protein